MLSAGAAEITITPPVGTPAIGTIQRSSGVNDDLWARALVLDDGQTRCRDRIGGFDRHGLRAGRCCPHGDSASDGHHHGSGPLHAQSFVAVHDPVERARSEMAGWTAARLARWPDGSDRGRRSLGMWTTGASDPPRREVGSSDREQPPAVDRRGHRHEARSRGPRRPMGGRARSGPRRWHALVCRVQSCGTPGDHSRREQAHQRGVSWVCCAPPQGAARRQCRATLRAGVRR